VLEEQGVFAPDIVQNIPDEYLRGAIREEGCPGKPQGAQYRRRASTNILRDLDLPLETSDIRRAPRGLGHNSGRMATEGAKPLREKVGSTLGYRSGSGRQPHASDLDHRDVYVARFPRRPGISELDSETAAKVNPLLFRLEDLFRVYSIHRAGLWCNCN
jgi:hypothetical protein